MTTVDVTFGAPVGLRTAVYSDLFVSYNERIPYLPPCSDMVLDSRHWLYIDERQYDKFYAGTHLLPGWQKHLTHLPEPDAVWVSHLAFIDRDGVPWLRTDTALEQNQDADYDVGMDADADDYGMGYVLRTPETKAAATCSGDDAR
ncbi:hypothetical protein ACIPSE_13015 [Streptomyces sp. NPDC090106]|uniref:hypothetical protein n=1 Tax=Streptomyces sp. NPDC090106 TaxID=3365946 RepID=UPI003819A92B